MLLLCLLLSLLGAPPQDKPQDKPELDGIAHVALRVSDIDNSRGYFLRLGIEEAFHFSDDKGEATVAYMKVNDRQFIELYRRNSPEEPLGLMHFCFDTADIAGLASAYESRGAMPTNPRKASAGNLLFNIYDPEKHLLEYTQYLPGSLHSKDHGQHMTLPRVSDHLIRAATPAKDVEAVRAFYVTKLHCETLKSDGPIRLRLPSKFHEEVELDTDAPYWKARLTFAVSDIQGAHADLARRGVSPQPVVGNSVTIAGLDGIHVVFVADP
jgi:catechol 2,3-dioxygenase-like lactoylglutathione lyase family enzyme